MNTKQSIITALALVSTVAALFGHALCPRIAQRELSLCTTNAQVHALKEKYEQKFAQREQELKEQFCELCGITPNEWQKLEAEILPKFIASEEEQVARLQEECPEPVHPEFKEVVDRLLAAKGMQPGSITLIKNKTFLPKIALMCAGSNYVVIEEETARTQFRKKDIEAFLAHELEHVKRKDYQSSWVMGYYAEAMLGLGNNSEYRAWERAHNLFHEQRVDTTIGFMGFDILNSRIQCSPNDFETQFSPSKKNHCRYMNKLKKDLLACMPAEQRGAMIA